MAENSRLSRLQKNEIIRQGVKKLSAFFFL
nr:MAG TPA: hypothetical protein [Caudoviricetes sp.]